MRPWFERAALRSTLLYRGHLVRRGARLRPSGRPATPWHNAVLQDRDEVEQAVRQVRTLGLVPHTDAPKNWDALAALDAVLSRTERSARVVDAGSMLYSSILPWLFAYGYRDLVGINLEFARPLRRGPIRYEPGDLTRTRFEDESVDAVTCLSVIEHGVPLAAYFAEMARILKPGGVLVTSTDYWHRPLARAGSRAYGHEVHVFSAAGLENAVAMAAEHGLRLTGDLDLTCREKPVRWARVGLDFTFAVFTHVKGQPTGHRTVTDAVQPGKVKSAA